MCRIYGIFHGYYTHTHTHTRSFSCNEKWKSRNVIYKGSRVPCTYMYTARVCARDLLSVRESYF